MKESFNRKGKFRVASLLQRHCGDVSRAKLEAKVFHRPLKRLLFAQSSQAVPSGDLDLKGRTIVLTVAWQLKKRLKEFIIYPYFYI